MGDPGGLNVEVTCPQWPLSPGILSGEWSWNVSLLAPHRHVGKGDGTRGSSCGCVGVCVPLFHLSWLPTWGQVATPAAVSSGDLCWPSPPAYAHVCTLLAHGVPSLSTLLRFLEACMVDRTPDGVADSGRSLGKLLILEVLAPSSLSEGGRLA